MSRIIIPATQQNNQIALFTMSQSKESYLKAKLANMFAESKENKWAYDVSKVYIPTL